MAALRPGLYGSGLFVLVIWGCSRTALLPGAETSSAGAANVPSAGGAAPGVSGAGGAPMVARGGAPASPGAGGVPPVMAGNGGSVASAGRPSCGPLIDDMEDQSGRICNGEGRKGVWYAFNDASSTQWPAKTTPGVPIPMSAIPEGRTGGGTFAVHTFGGAFTGWGAGVGFDFAFDGMSYGRYDASRYSGLSFWARGAPGQMLRFRVGSVSTTAAQYGGACGERCSGPVGVAVPLGPAWRYFVVPFSELTNAGGLPAGETDRLTNVQFMPLGVTSFDYWVDDVSFTEGAPSCCPPLPACGGGSVQFREAQLNDAAVAKYPDDLRLSCEEACGLRALAAPERGLSDAGGLECLSNMSVLALPRNLLSSLEPLRALERLTRLDLSNNLIVDIGPLSGLSNLAQLNLSHNQVSEISALPGLKAMLDLDLSYNQLVHTRLLQTLPNLTTLDLTHNGLASSALALSLPLLRTLRLGQNSVTDLSALSRLPSLTWLELNENQVASVEPLSGLANLQTLLLAQNQLVNLAPLSGLAALTRLELAQNLVVDPSPLTKLGMLQSLDLSGNRISDARLLSGLRVASQLNLADNQIDVIEDIASWPSAPIINLANNGLSALPALAGQVLHRLDLSGNALTDVSALAGVVFQNLPCNGRCGPIPGTLNLSGNPIRDVSPLLQAEVPGANFRIDLRDTLLSCSEQAAVLAALRARALVVETSCD